MRNDAPRGKHQAILSLDGPLQREKVAVSPPSFRAALAMNLGPLLTSVTDARAPNLPAVDKKHRCV